MHEEVQRFCDFFIHFLGYFFILWPDIPQQERPERRKNALGMLDIFVHSFQEKLRKGGHLYKLSPEHLPELFIENAPELELEEQKERHDKEHKKDDYKPRVQANSPKNKVRTKEQRSNA